MPVYARKPPVALAHPEHGGFVVPSPGQPYNESDPLVVAHAWAFGSPEEIEAADAVAAEPVTEVAIETADRSRKRTRSRPLRESAADRAARETAEADAAARQAEAEAAAAAAESAKSNHDGE